MSLTTVKVEKTPLRLYSEQEKRDAVALYFALGTQSAVAQATGIPQRTVSDWMKTDWWNDYHRDLVRYCRDEQGAGYRRVVSKALGSLLDRLTHGDLILDRKGRERRKPISAKDLTVIMAIATDKDRILRGEPTSISAKAPSLTAAAAEFAKIADQDKTKAG